MTARWEHYPHEADIGVRGVGALVGVIAADDLVELFAEELSGLARLVGAAPRREKERRRAAL